MNLPVEKPKSFSVPVAGIKPGTAQSFAAADVDCSSQVPSAQAAHSDAVCGIGDFPGVMREQTRNVGLNVPSMFNTPTTNSLLIESLGQEADGLVPCVTLAVQLPYAATVVATIWEPKFKADWAKVSPEFWASSALRVARQPVNAMEAAKTSVAARAGDQSGGR
jgi:hypothetical protein